MAGLETVVRPAVFPDIRPSSARDARPVDPDRGRAHINGSGGQVIDLAQSFSQNTQKQHVSEEYRVFDIIRIYRTFQNANGQTQIDRNSWIDQEVMWQVITVLHTGETRRTIYRKPQPQDYPNGNMEIIAENIIRKTRGPGNLVDLILP